RTAGETVLGGPYTISAVLIPTNVLSNYAITYNTALFTINTAPLTITANSRSKTYGDTVTFAGTEFTSNGLVRGDTVTSVNLMSAGAAATATVAGSPYAITPSAAVGTGLSNYAITYANGALTVNPKALIVTADNQTKITGEANPPFTVSYSGFVVGQGPS